VPSAYRHGIDWFIERKTSEMLEQIQPMLDELQMPPASTTVPAATHADEPAG